MSHGTSTSKTLRWYLHHCLVAVAAFGQLVEQPAASILVLLEAFAEGPFVPQFGTWAQRDGCSAVGPDSSWVVQPASPFPFAAIATPTAPRSTRLFSSRTMPALSALERLPRRQFMRDAESCDPYARSVQRPGEFATCDQCLIGKYSPVKVL